MQPAMPIEVDAAEYADLSRQGLLMPGSAGAVPAGGGGPVGAQADMHIDQPSQEPVSGTGDAAQFDQPSLADPAEPDHQENPA
jgi:hypothetical protein